jgi:hypothetical protein
MPRGHELNAGNTHHRRPSYRNRLYPEISLEHAEYRDFSFRQCVSSFQDLHILS